MARSLDQQPEAQDAGRLANFTLSLGGALVARFFRTASETRLHTGKSLFFILSASSIAACLPINCASIDMVVGGGRQFCDASISSKPTTDTSSPGTSPSSYIPSDLPYT